MEKTDLPLHVAQSHNPSLTTLHSFWTHSLTTAWQCSLSRHPLTDVCFSSCITQYFWSFLYPLPSPPPFFFFFRCSPEPLPATSFPHPQWRLKGAGSDSTGIQLKPLVQLGGIYREGKRTVMMFAATLACHSQVIEWDCWPGKLAVLPSLKSETSLSVCCLWMKLWLWKPVFTGM